MSHESLPPHQNQNTYPGMHSPEQQQRQELLDAVSLAAEGSVAWQGSFDLPFSDMHSMVDMAGRRKLDQVPPSSLVTEQQKRFNGSGDRGDRKASFNTEYLNDLRVAPDAQDPDRLSFIPRKDGSTEVRYDFKAPSDKFGRPNPAILSFHLPKKAAIELQNVVDGNPSVADDVLERLVTDLGVSQETFNTAVKPTHERGSGQIVIREYDTNGGHDDLSVNPSLQELDGDYSKFINVVEPSIVAEANHYGETFLGDDNPTEVIPAALEDDKPTEPVDTEAARKNVEAALHADSTPQKETAASDSEGINDPKTPDSTTDQNVADARAKVAAAHNTAEANNTDDESKPKRSAGFSGMNEIEVANRDRFQNESSTGENDTHVVDAEPLTDEEQRAYDEEKKGYYQSPSSEQPAAPGEQDNSSPENDNDRTLKEILNSLRTLTVQQAAVFEAQTGVPIDVILQKFAERQSAPHQQTEGDVDTDTAADATVADRPVISLDDLSPEERRKYAPILKTDKGGSRVARLNGGSKITPPVSSNERIEERSDHPSLPRKIGLRDGKINNRVALLNAENARLIFVHGTELGMDDEALESLISDHNLSGRDARALKRANSKYIRNVAKINKLLPELAT